MASNGSSAFLKAFLRHPGRVGAIAPSSRHLADAMLQDLVPPGRGETLVEFGPGTGAITASIARFLPSPDRYLGIERDPALVTHLRSRFPELTFVRDSAENTSHILEDQERSRVSAVISGLPFASLPGGVRRQILEDLGNLLGTRGTFRTFQYVHAYLLPKAKDFRREMTLRFGPPRRIGPVLRNLPPAWVLSWEPGEGRDPTMNAEKVTR